MIARIALHGRDVDDSELELLGRVADASKAASEYGCQPVMEINGEEPNQ